MAKILTKNIYSPNKISQEIEKGLPFLSKIYKGRTTRKIGGNRAAYYFHHMHGK